MSSQEEIKKEKEQWKHDLFSSDFNLCTYNFLPPFFAWTLAVTFKAALLIIHLFLCIQRSIHMNLQNREFVQRNICTGL